MAKAKLPKPEITDEVESGVELLIETADSDEAVMEFLEKGNTITLRFTKNGTEVEYNGINETEL